MRPFVWQLAGVALVASCVRLGACASTPSRGARRGRAPSAPQGMLKCPRIISTDLDELTCKRMEGSTLVLV